MSLHQILQSTCFREFWLLLLQVTVDLRSSCDLSVNHLGVLLHGETQVLVLHGCHVEVDLWDGRDHFAKLQLLLPLLDICIGSWMLRDWLAAAFLCEVFLLVLRLVSVAVLWFALPAVGCALLLPAVGSALVLLFIIAPDLRCSSRAVLVPVLLHFILLFSDSLTTGSLAVVPFVLLLQSHVVVVFDSMVRF